jgi:glycosyltransferase involved in cell wall biosynthesis
VHVRDLASALQRRGDIVRVFVGGTLPGPVTEELDRLDVPWELIPSLRRVIDPLSDVAAVWQLRNALRAFAPEIVSTHTAKAGLVGRLAASMLRLPSIYTPHGWSIGDRLSRRSGTIFAMVERLAARWCDRIVNVCEAERELAARHGIPDHGGRLAVIHNGVHDVAGDLRAKAGRAVEIPQIVTVARMEEPKDHVTLLEALALVKDCKWRLNWIGDGPFSGEIRQRALGLGIADRIEFLGHRDARPILAASHVFVLSSRSEGFPRSILEAMRSALPVVATRVGGVAEAVADKRNGWLAERGDAQGMAAGLRLLLSRPDLRASVGAANRDRYEKEFSFDRMLNKTTRLWEEVLSRRAAAQAGVTLLEGTNQ